MVNKWHLEIVALEETLADHAKCIRQLVLTVGKNVKFLSSRLEIDQFIAKSVTQNIENTNRIKMF
jgi:hypothetical protein